MKVRFKKFNWNEQPPKCFASNCKQTAVYKSSMHFRYGKPIGFCKKHVIVLEDLDLYYNHICNSSKH